MTDREELRKLIIDGLEISQGLVWLHYKDLDKAIDAILKAGYRKEKPDDIDENSDDWKVRFIEEFEKAYKGILTLEIISQSIKWHLDFMGPYIRRKPIAWPKPMEHTDSIGLERLRNDNLTHDCHVDGYNEALAACKIAVNESENK